MTVVGSEEVAEEVHKNCQQRGERLSLLDLEAVPRRRALGPGVCGPRTRWCPWRRRS